MASGLSKSYPLSKFTTQIIVLSFTLKTTYFAFTQDKQKDITSPSLAELMQVRVSTGSLTNFLTKHSPSITTIPKQQVEISTARNLATLPEQIDQWDLEDIEKIEVIRTPSSLPYSSGANCRCNKYYYKNGRQLLARGTCASYTPIYRSRGANFEYTKSYICPEKLQFMLGPRTIGFREK